MDKLKSVDEVAYVRFALSVIESLRILVLIEEMESLLRKTGVINNVCCYS